VAAASCALPALSCALPDLSCALPALTKPGGVFDMTSAKMPASLGVGPVTCERGSRLEVLSVAHPFSSAVFAIPNVESASIQSLYPVSPPTSEASSPVESSPLATRYRPLLSRTSSSTSLGSPRAFTAQVYPFALLHHAIDIEFNGDADWLLAQAARTLYAKVPVHAAKRADMRSTIVAVIDRADDLACDGLIFVLEKHDPDLATLLHALLYVGGTVIGPSVSKHDATRFVLVGLDV